MTEEPFPPRQRLLQGATGVSGELRWRFSAIPVQKLNSKPTHIDSSPLPVSRVSLLLPSQL